jgi:hypothetical protein
MWLVSAAYPQQKLPSLLINLQPCQYVAYYLIRWTVETHRDFKDLQ